jgi:hypothetical protein
MANYKKAQLTYTNNKGQQTGHVMKETQKHK